MQLDQPTIDKIERELCARSITHFVYRAWPHIIPDAYQHSWHIDAVAEHLQAVASGEINRLLVNIPPGSSKSTMIGVMYPAWLWGPGGHPGHRYIGASHEQGLAVRDNRLMRELVTSQWYQRLWPIGLKGDQNEKLYFENDQRGFRQACAVASMTGRRGHTIAWDDPLNPEKANSEVHRETAIRVLTETLPTRLNDPKSSAIIVVMQRLHEADPAGHILSSEGGYEHLCLPMEFEPERRCTTSIGWTDPRTEEGELLDPVRFPAKVVERDKRDMGSYAWAGQMQQRPTPRGGAMLKRAWFDIVKAPPAGCRWVRAWDLAATASNGADWTVGVLIGRTPDGQFVVADVQRAQAGPAAVRAMIRNTAMQDKIRGKVTVDLPQDPGQAGKAQAQDLVKMLAGHKVQASPETGDKITRAEPFAAQAEAGNVALVEGPWNAAYLDEIETFPMGKHDDQVDATSRAFNALASASVYDLRALAS